MVNNFPYSTLVKLGESSVQLTNFGVVSKNPHWQISSHQHNHFELHYVENGLGTNISATDEIQLSHGTLYIAKPKEAHAQFSDPRDPMKLFYVGFDIDPDKSDPWGLDHVCDVLNCQSKIVLPNCFHLEPLLTRMLNEAIEQKENHNLMIHSLFSQLIVEILRTVKEIHNKIQNNTVAQPDLLRIQNTLAYMKENINQPYDIDILTGISHMSSSHFRRLFRQIVGISPGKYLRNLKINHAKILLASSHSVQEAAEKVGFESVESFSKTFKKIVGVSPSQYHNVP